MQRKTGALVSIMALALGVLLFAVPSPSRADVIITDISVTNPNVTYTGGAAGNTWTFTPITLAPGQSLVLTQNQAGAPSTLPSGQPGFNFDTSEGGGVKATQYTVAVNGTKFVDNSPPNTSAGVLADSGNDIPASTTQNESANWVKIGGVANSYDLYVGYADTLHSAGCQDGGNCLPFFAGNLIWDGTGGSTAATRFIGHASNIPGYGGAGFTTHCNVNQTVATSFDCWDAGALLIVSLSAVPEPSTVFLVGTLIVGLTAWAVRNRRKIAQTPAAL